MYGLYHDCARTRKRSLVGKLAMLHSQVRLVLLENPQSLPVPSRVSCVLACLVMHVPATLPVSCTAYFSIKIYISQLHVYSI